MNTLVMQLREAGPWAPAVALAVAKATILLLMTICAAALLRRASAAVRHLVWTLGLTGVLLLPVLSAGMPWRLPVLPSVAAPAADAGPSAVTAADPPATMPAAPSIATPAAGTSAAVSTAPAAPAPRSNLPLVLLAVWAAGALVLAGRLAAGMLAVRRIVRGSTPVRSERWQTALFEAADRLDLPDVPALVRSGRAEMPFTCGVLRPVIVLPMAAEEWNDEQVRAVLCHELGHVRRLDLAGHLASRLLCAVYWFNPLVWVAARRLRAESERACDDLVLSTGTRPSVYAGHLLEIVGRARVRRAPATAVAMAQRKEFEGRVLAILAPAVRRGVPTRRQTAALAAGLLGVTVACSAVAPMDADEREAAAPVVTVAGTELADARQALRLDPNATVRRTAAWELGTAKDRGSVAVLAAALATDASPQVREMSAWALGQAGGAEGVAPLAAAVRDADPTVRHSAVWALTQIRAQSGAPGLEAVLAADPSPWLRKRAAWALGDLKPGTAPAALVAALNDRDEDVRKAAAWSLGRIGDAGALPALSQAIRTGDEELRQDALWAVYQMRGSLPRTALRAAISPALESGDEELRERAAGVYAGTAQWPWPWPWPMPWPRQTADARVYLP